LQQMVLYYELIFSLCLNVLSLKYCKNDQLTNAIDFRVSILSKFQLKFSNLSVWLPDDLNELTKRINRRIRMATTLNIEHGEELQVANYGLGGYYAPHYDYARVNLNFSDQKGEIVNNMLFFIKLQKD
uniref:P4Hc domain-containing protein n=1 Tax=Hymenolepis diminuta TaxID=6216 RepID=A0A0R3SMK5_HYMDI